MVDTSSIKKPLADDRDIQALVLANGVKVMYVHDPLSTETYVSLSFKVGSYNNPAEVKGLAHFLEHMLFLSSEKYPEMDYFANYVEKLQGSYNAYTATEFTNFISKVYTQELSQIDLLLDILVHMFVAPVINPAMLEKEVAAVDSEYEMHMHDDTTKIMDVLEAQMPAAHPLGIFSCGNKKTLWTAFENKDFLQDIILLFRQYHYGARNASVVISGPIAPAPMLKIIEAKFGLLANYEFEPFYQKFVTKYPSVNVEGFFKRNESMQPFKSMFPIQQPLSGFEVQSVGNSDDMGVLFQVNIADTLQEEAFFSFVRHLLYQSDKGSLEHYLKEDLKLRNFVFEDYNEFGDVHLIWVDFRLAPGDIKDAHKLQLVLNAYYKYLDFLAAQPEAALAKQYAYFTQLSLLRFNYSEPQRDMFRNSEIANNILKYGFADAFKSKEEYPVYNHSLFRNIVTQLRQSHAMLVLKPSANKTSTFAQVSPHYDAHFDVLDPADPSSKWWPVLDTLRQGPALKNTILYFSLPFKPALDLHISEKWFKSAEYVVAPQALPQLETVPGVHYFMLRDGYYGRPDSILDIFVNSKVASDSYQHYALAHLVTQLVHDKFHSDYYHWVEMGYSLTVSSKINGYRIQLKGFSKWMLLVLQDLLDIFRSEAVFTDATKVNKDIDQWIDSLSNFKQARPYQKLKLFIQQLLVQTKVMDTPVLLTDLQSLRKSWQGSQAVLAYRDLMLSSVGFANVLLHGDVDAPFSQQVADKLKSVFTHTDPAQIMTQQTVRLPPQYNSKMDLPNNNPKENQNTISWFYQVHKYNKYKEYCLAEILSNYASNHIFTALRTKKQIGYVSTFMFMRYYKSQNVLSLIQGNKYSLAEMQSMHADWVTQFTADIALLSDADFALMYSNTRNVIEAKYNSLHDKTSFILEQLDNQTREFDIEQKYLLELNSIDKATLIDYAHYVFQQAPSIQWSLSKSPSNTDQMLYSKLNEFNATLQAFGYYPNSDQDLAPTNNNQDLDKNTNKNNNLTKTQNVNHSYPS